MTKEIELRIAVHEAGHAIVCIDQDKPFDSIDIIQNGFEYGHIHGADKMNREKDWRQELMKTVLYLFGGHAADSIFYKKQPADLFNSSLNGSEKDMEKVYAIGKEVLKLSDGEMKEYVSSSMTRAMEIVDRRWADVNKLAIALMAKKSLTYTQCKALIK